MKHLSILTQLFTITLLLSACGAKAAPTANPIDFQGTMLAAASTGIALTQTAIPTATVTLTATVTDTPIPTVALPVVPTAGGASTSVAVPSPVVNPSTQDPCINQVLPATLNGKQIKIRIDNPTKATVNVTVYLQQARAGSVCGYRAYSLGAGEPLVINDLVEGCYSIWAWNPDPKNYFMVTNGTSCLDASTNWTFDISTNGIKLRS